MTTPIIWIVIGLALMVTELLIPSFIIVFFGFAAVVTGVLLWLGLPDTNGIPYFVFSVVAIASLWFLRDRFRTAFGGKTIDVVDGGPVQSGADEDFIGREVTVLNGFDARSPDRGQVTYRGAAWSAQSASESFTEGQRVTIVARHGSTLTVSNKEG